MKIRIIKILFKYNYKLEKNLSHANFYYFKTNYNNQIFLV